MPPGGTWWQCLYWTGPARCEWRCSLHRHQRDFLWCDGHGGKDIHGCVFGRTGPHRAADFQRWNQQPTAPSTDFQTVLGYSNTSGSATGLIDAINCNGGTGTAQAISLGYNELYKKNLPGALNFIMLFTDG